MGKRFSNLTAGGENARTYRDPQEFMFAEEHDDAAEVYSIAMRIFYKYAGKDYFEAAGTPEDECFMMSDPDSDESVIDVKFVPEEIKDIADLLVKATVYKRNRRISMNDFLAGLSEHENDSEDTVSVQNEKPVTENITDDTSAKNNAPSDNSEAIMQNDVSDISENPVENEGSCSELTDRFSVLPDHDYGIILNNKRSGRIEYKPLLFSDGKCESFTVPVESTGEFVIAVSRRHRDDAAYSNPSSVYGDRIIPVGLAAVSSVSGQKIKISLGNRNGKLEAEFTDISLSGAESNTRTAEWR
jgi:hypothetical protein